MGASAVITVGNKEVKIQGGLIRIAHIDGDKYNFPDDPEQFIAELQKSGRRVDVFTFLQKLPETAPKYTYPMELDNLAVLPVSTFDHWWNRQIRSYPRNRARQAEKRGVVLREVPYGDELIQGICGIYNETPVRQGKAFPYYGMTPDQARAYAGTYLDRSIYVGAFVGETMIGFIKLVMDENHNQACLVHILSMVEHKDKAPTNALIAHAVRCCAERKVPFLVYEHFTYGKKEGDSLSHFKEVNGFQRIDLPRYYVPLTPIGRAALRFGFHHRLIDRLPESWLGKLRDWRKAWYDRKLQTVTEV
ncbi:MAG TPA: hypothetical protein VNW47_03840 [Terriglobales bacterium]|nr:hypothetical protein [Terriglobales bacterium]